MGEKCFDERHLRTSLNVVWFLNSKKVSFSLKGYHKNWRLKCLQHGHDWISRAPVQAAISNNNTVTVFYERGHRNCSDLPTKGNPFKSVITYNYNKMEFYYILLLSCY